MNSMLLSEITDRINQLLIKYNVPTNSVVERSIKIMLQHESEEKVYHKIVEFFEGDGAKQFSNTLETSNQIIVDHQSLSPEEFRSKWGIS